MGTWACKFDMMACFSAGENVRTIWKHKVYWLCKSFIYLKLNKIHQSFRRSFWFFVLNSIHKDKSYHCDVCNVCLDKRLEGKHKCRPDSGHDECCICLEVRIEWLFAKENEVIRWHEDLITRTSPTAVFYLSNSQACTKCSVDKRVWSWQESQK